MKKLTLFSCSLLVILATHVLGQIPDVTWGEPVDGVRLGLVKVTPEEARISIDLILENKSENKIRYGYELRNGTFFLYTEDESGKETLVWNSLNEFSVSSTDAIIAPGEKFPFSVSLPADKFGKVLSDGRKAVIELIVDTGKA